MMNIVRVIIFCTFINLLRNLSTTFYAFHRPICAIFLPNTTRKTLSTHEINALQHENALYDFYSLVDTYQKTR